MVRAGERNRLRLDYFTLDRTGSATLTQPILFRDSVLQTGDPLQSMLGSAAAHPHLRLFVLAQ